MPPAGLGGQLRDRQREQGREPARRGDADGAAQEGGDLGQVLRHRREGALLRVEAVELAAGREVADQPVGDPIVAHQGQAGAHRPAAGGPLGPGQGLGVARIRVEERLEQAAQGHAVGGHHVVAGTQRGAAAGWRHATDTLGRELEEQHAGRW